MSKDFIFRWMVKGSAITIGQYAFYQSPEAYAMFKKHEDKHKEQYQRYGFLGFLGKYFSLLIKYGYWNNPLEIEAREANDGN